MVKKILIPALVLLVVTLACALPSLPGADTGDDTTTDSNTLLTEDFSDTESGWYVFTDSDGRYAYSDGGYKILVTTTDLMLYATSPQDFQSDVHVEVDATKAGGPDDNAFGLICRAEDLDNFYWFAISSDGYAGIGSNENADLYILSGEYLEESDAVYLGEATNHIAADCVGSTLTLFVNGSEVVSVTDTSFSGGSVGLFAKAYTEMGVEIIFDNLLVTKP